MIDNALALQQLEEPVPFNKRRRPGTARSLKVWRPGVMRRGDTLMYEPESGRLEVLRHRTATRRGTLHKRQVQLKNVSVDDLCLIMRAVGIRVCRMHGDVDGRRHFLRVL